MGLSCCVLCPVLCIDCASTQEVREVLVQISIAIKPPATPSRLEYVWGGISVCSGKEIRKFKYRLEIRAAKIGVKLPGGLATYENTIRPLSFQIISPICELILSTPRNTHFVDASGLFFVSL